jgi:glucose/arabinose dehydrogenase
VVVSRCAAALLLLVLAGCGRDQAAGPENVEVSSGAEQVAVRPTQYCLNGDGQRYSNTPPIIEVSPDSPITLKVPASVAEHGWSVQVFDEKLEEPIGEVAVPQGEDVFAEINTSDVVPPAFYLVVVENKGGACGEFSGAWPVGFLRAGGDLSGTPSGTAASAG